MRSASLKYHQGGSDAQIVISFTRHCPAVLFSTVHSILSRSASQSFASDQSSFCPSGATIFPTNTAHSPLVFKRSTLIRTACPAWLEASGRTVSRIAFLSGLPEPPASSAEDKIRWVLSYPLTACSSLPVTVTCLPAREVNALDELSVRNVTSI